MTTTRASSAPEIPSRYFPNVVLRTQDNQRMRFYDDLIRDKVVLINFFYTTCAAACELATTNLVKVAASLGDEVGKSVIMLSVTIDPKTDTPAVLKKYAQRHGTRRGWYFVTGARQDIDVLRERLGLRDRADSAITHTGLVAYGNVATGQWAATPVMADAHTIARSVMRLVKLSSSR